MKRILLTLVFGLASIIVVLGNEADTIKVDSAQSNKTNDELLRESIVLQNNAAHNLDNAYKKFEGEIEHYETFFFWFIGGLSLLAIVFGYTYREKLNEINDKIKELSNEVDNAKDSANSIKIQETQITELNKRISDKENELEKIKTQYSLQNDIELMRRNFSSIIFNNGVNFKNSLHQKKIKDINSKINEVLKLGADEISQYDFFKGCGILVGEIESEKANGVRKVENYLMAEKKFVDAIDKSESQFYFEAYDAKHYLYLAIEEYEKAKEVSTIITENRKTEYSIVKKIEDFIRFEKINDDELKEIQSDSKLLRELNKGAYIRFQIEINIRAGKVDDLTWFQQLMNLDSDYSYENNLGLYGKMFLIKGELDIARKCFKGAIDRFEEMYNKSRDGMNVLNIQLSANKLGLLLCEVKENNYKEEKLEKLFSISPLFKDENGWAELNRKYLIFITELERDLIRKVKI